MSKAFISGVLKFTKRAIGPLGRKAGQQGKRPAQGRARALRVESLESRRLLTGTTISLDGSNNLLISGNTAGSNLGLSYNSLTTQYTITDSGDITTVVAGATGSGTTSVTIPKGSISGAQVIVDLAATSGESDTLTLALGATAFPQSVVCNGGTGAETLVVNLPSSDTLPANGITFSGDASATSNALDLSGAGQNVTYTADGSTAGKGTLGDGTGTISFTNLSPIDMHGLGTATITASAGDAPVELVNGVDFTQGGVNPAIVVEPNGSGTQFESVALWDNTTVDVSSSNAVTVNSANNAHNNTNLSIQTSVAAGTISIAGPVAVTGNVTLTANSATIAESGSGKIAGGLLTTTSSGGTTLNGANAVSSFNATNSASGNIQLTNNMQVRAPATTITGISEAGGNVQVVNAGGMTITGTVSDTAVSGIVSLKDSTANIQESGAGLINANLLITQSKTGTALAGANTVSDFIAVDDPTGANIVLADNATVAAALTISSIIETGGNVTITNSGGINIAGTIKDLGGTVSLTESFSSIQETGGQIIASQLTTQSKTETILNGSNVVTTFNATNSTSGDVQFNDATGPLTISGVSETFGNVQIIDFGGMTITGTVADSSGIVSLKEFTANIVESGSGLIEANQLIVQSKTGVTLNGANTASNLFAVNDPMGGNVQLTNTAAPLTISNLIETAGSVTIVNTGGISITGTIKDQSGNVSLQDTSAAIQESGGQIIANQLTTQSATGAILNGGNDIATFNATNSTSGDVQLNNSVSPAAALTVSGITNSNGNVQVINSGGISVTGAIAASSASGIVSLADSSANITESGSGAISGNYAIDQAVTGIALNGANAVTNLYAANTTSGNTQFNNTASSLTIQNITKSGGNVQVTATGGISLLAGATINSSGTVTLDVGSTGAGSTSTIGGTIASTAQVAVNGGTGADNLTIDLSTTSLPATGLLYNGGGSSASDNLTVLGPVLNSSNGPGYIGNYFAVYENGNDSTSPGSLQSSQGPSAAAKLNFANIQTLDINGKQGNNFLDFHVGTGANPLTQMVYDGGSGWNGMAVYGAAGNNTIGVGDTKTPSITSVDVTTYLAANDYQPATVNVPLRLMVNSTDLAILQMFGGSGINTLVNASAVASAMLVGSTSQSTLVGGVGGLGSPAATAAGVDVLVGGSNADTLYGRGATNYLMGGYGWVSKPSPGVAATTPTPPPKGYNNLVGSEGYNYYVGNSGDYADGIGGTVVGNGIILSPELQNSSPLFVYPATSVVTTVNEQAAVKFVSADPN